MADLIRIKRSGTSGNPSVLANGELAYSYFDGAGGNKLYIGTGSENNLNAADHTIIGGKYYTDLLGGENAPFGIVTPNTALIADSNGELDAIKVGKVTLTTSILENDSGDLNLVSAGNVNLGGSSRLVNLLDPVDPQDAVTKTYADDIAASVVFTVGANGEVTTFTPSQTTLTFEGGLGLSAQLDSVNNSITFGLDSSGVTADTYGDETKIPRITVDHTGRITDVTTSDIATSLTVNGDTVSLLDSDITFSGSSNVNVTYDSSTNTVDYSLDSEVTGLSKLVVGNLEIDGNTIKSTDSSNEIIIDPAPTDSDGGTLVIRGDLVVQGTQTTIHSTEVSVNDLTFTLASGATSDLEADGAGIIIGGADASILYDAQNDRLTTNKGLDINGPLSINGESIGEVIDDKVSNLLVGGEGLTLEYNDSDDQYSVSADLATTSSTGVASFDSAQFSVDSVGHVNIHSLDGDNTLIKLKTYDSAGVLPTEQELNVGELAINTADGKVFVKRQHEGIGSIIELGSGLGDGSGGTFDTFDYVASQEQVTITGQDTFGNGLEYDVGGRLLVFLNGVLLNSSIDYVANDGLSIVFTVPLDAGYHVQVAAYRAAIIDIQNDLNIEDNVRLLIGTGYDALLTHDGTNTILEQRPNATGDLKIRHSDSDVMSVKQNEVILHKSTQIKDYGIDTNKVITSGNMDPIVIDTVPLSDFRTARYTIQISNISNMSYQSNELLLVHDGVEVYTTLYGELHTGPSPEASIEVNIVGTNMVVTISPNSTHSYEFKSVRHSVSV